MRDDCLRVFASVSPTARVLVVGGDDIGRDLERLGFDASLQDAGASLERDPESFDWAVLVLDHPDAEALTYVSDALRPGGWVWLAVTMSGNPKRLSDWAESNGFALAQTAQRDEGTGVLFGVYRRVGEGITA